MRTGGKRRIDIAKELAEGRWADTAEGGEYEGDEVHSEGIAAGSMFGDFFGGLGEEDGFRVGYSGGKV